MPILAGLLLVASACTSVYPATSLHARANASSETTAPQSTPAEAALGSLEDSCGLINSRDLAHLFNGHTETMLPKPQINQVVHPAFATGAAPGTETSCVYYTFHLPGSHAEVVLQVNYWLDVPTSSSADSAWTRDWAVANAGAGQAMPRLADEAFYKNGRLSFKENDFYVTLQAIETDWNLESPGGSEKQLATERQIAIDMLARMDCASSGRSPH
jgi:hypothetical protein